MRGFCSSKESLGCTEAGFPTDGSSYSLRLPHFQSGTSQLSSPITATAGMRRIYTVFPITPNCGRAIAAGSGTYATVLPIDARHVVCQFGMTVESRAYRAVQGRNRSIVPGFKQKQRRRHRLSEKIERQSPGLQALPEGALLRLENFATFGSTSPWKSLNLIRTNSAWEPALKQISSSSVSDCAT